MFPTGTGSNNPSPGTPPADNKGKPDITNKTDREVFQEVDDVTDDDKKGGKEPDDKPSKEAREKAGEEGEEIEDVDDDEDVDEDEDKSEETDEDDEENDEEDEELKTDGLYQKLKAVSPKIFKEVPELRSVIFAEQEYRNLFPSVKDAKEAVELNQTFTKLNDDITSGEAGSLLKGLENVGKENLETFLSNFMPAVKEHSKDLYLQMTYPLLKEAIRAAIKSGDERLEVSAKNIHWFLFGDHNIDAEVGFKPQKKDPREDKISERERQFEKRQYESFSKDLGHTVKTRAERFIQQAFKDSDLTSFMQETLTEKIFQRVDKAIAEDRRLQGNLANLWKQAKKEGFTTQSKDSISNAYLSRAKVLIPKIRQQVLSEAKLTVKTGDDKPPVDKKRIPSSGSTNASVAGAAKPANGKVIDWEATSEKDALDGNYKYKKES